MSERQLGKSEKYYTRQIANDDADEDNDYCDNDISTTKSDI